MTESNDRNGRSRRRHPRLRRALTTALWVLVAVALVWIGVAQGDRISDAVARTGAWLGLVEPEGEEEKPLEYYTCGMHPWVLETEPGLCPICHMKLEKLDPEQLRAELAIDPVMVQNMGVRVGAVKKGPLTKTLRTVGTVAYKEPAVRDINIKVSGWIETLRVDYEGAPVSKGDVLFELYSPQLYAAQEEYLLAWRNRQRGAEQEALLRAARTRLEFFDITDEQIRALQEAGRPRKTLAIHSPYAGVVVDKHAREGMKVDPGMRVFRIADLSNLWVMVTLYEYQLPYVSEGQKAVMTLPYLPGQRFEGEVVYIYPTVDPETREVQVRLEFDNPSGLLKPGMFATVTLHSTLAAERTLVPREAVIDTGRRQVAFVWKGRGRFEPRDVILGVEAEDGMVEVQEGLQPGEQVVTSGQFLLDSEANIREARAKMIEKNLASRQEGTAAPAGPPPQAELPDAAAAALAEALQAYFQVSDALAHDTLDGVGGPARRLAGALKRLLDTDIPDRPHFWHRHGEVATARGAALELVNVEDLAAARLKLADISIALRTLLQNTGVPAQLGQEVHVLHCPMYRQGQGGTVWLSPAEEVRNPYYGSQMPQCFDERYALPPMGPAGENGAGGDDEQAPVGAGGPAAPAPREHENGGRQ